MPPGNNSQAWISSSLYIFHCIGPSLLTFWIELSLSIYFITEPWTSSCVFCFPFCLPPHPSVRALPTCQFSSQSHPSVHQSVFKKKTLPCPFTTFDEVFMPSYLRITQSLTKSSFSLSFRNLTLEHAHVSRFKPFHHSNSAPVPQGEP